MSRATQTLQWPVQRAAKSQDGANPTKTGPSSDCRLELAYMKSELLVIAYQHGAVNTFSGLVHTACQGTEVALARRPYLMRPKVRVVTRLKS